MIEDKRVYSFSYFFIMLLPVSVLLTLLIRSSFQALFSNHGKLYSCFIRRRPNWWSVKRFYPVCASEQRSSLFVQILSTNNELDQLNSLVTKKAEPSSNKSQNRVYRYEKNTLISEKIKAIFSVGSNSHNEVSASLQDLISKHKNDLNHIHAISLLYRSARARFPLYTVIPLQFLAAILSRQHNRNIRAGEVAQIIYGLRLMSIETDSPTPPPPASEGGVQMILKVANEKLLECEDIFNGKDIASSLYGLQKFTGSEPEVLDLLRNLAEKFRSSNATLNGQEISNSLYGINHIPESILIK